MGLLKNIKEKIQMMRQRIKTPKLGSGENYQQNQCQYQDARNINYLQQPYTITRSNNDEQLMLTSIQFNNQIKHSNGEITNLMIAKVCHYQDGETIYFNQQESVAFEVPAGAQIDDFILQKIGIYYMYERNMPDKNKECMYLGKLSQDPYDLGTHNKSEAVNRYINEKVEPQIAREKQEQIERQMASYRERQEREQSNAEKYRKKVMEEQKEYIYQQQQIKIARMENPYLKQIGREYLANDGKKYCDYDGVNVVNGDILKLRKMNKVGKDENGTYIYTGYIESTENEYDVEMLSKDGTPAGIPVCFATDRKIEEIMQSNNPRDLKILLSMLSEAEEFINDNGYLNYIGSINKYNTTDKNIENTSRTIQSTVERLQQKFYQERVKEQNENQIEY